MQLTWGVDVAALLLSIVAIFKVYTDKVNVVQWSLTVWLTGLAMGLSALLAMNADAIAAWSPVPALVLNNVAAVLVPLFVILGVWKPVSGAYRAVKATVSAKMLSIRVAAKDYLVVDLGKNKEK